MVGGWVTLGSQVHPGRVRGTYLYSMGPGFHWVPNIDRAGTILGGQAGRAGGHL